MHFFKKKRSNKVDPDHLSRKAEASLSSTKARQQHVNLISSWLIWRTEENGFGGDFDFTISPQKLTPRESQ
jgi:hypothetical protein